MGLVTCLDVRLNQPIASMTNIFVNLKNSTDGGQVIRKYKC